MALMELERWSKQGQRAKQSMLRQLSLLMKKLGWELRTPGSP